MAAGITWRGSVLLTLVSSDNDSATFTTTFSISNTGEGQNKHHSNMCMQYVHAICACTHLIIIGVVCTCPYVWVQVYLLPVVLLLS